ncbi:hypothetical protein ABH941_003201 [Streptacidiphilus sp. EB103A]
MAVHCSACGHVNADDAGFCGSCGQAITTLEPVAVAPSVPDAESTTVLGAVPVNGVAEGLATVPEQLGALLKTAGGAAAGLSRGGGSGIPTRRTVQDGPLGGVGRDEATRHLCAAVHLDSALAEKLVENVLEEPLRAVSRSPGLDLVAVMKHVVAARARHLVRDLSLVAALVLMFICLVTLHLGLFVLLLVVSWLVVFVEAYLVRWGPTTLSLRRGAFRAADAPQPQRQLTIEQIQRVAQYEAGNVSAYLGEEFLPFSGYGWPLDSWSFALDTTRPEDPDRPVEPFSVTELYERVKEQVAKLDIAGLGVSDRLFINGFDMHHDPDLLTGSTPAARLVGRPVERVAQEFIDELRERPEDRARPYLVAEVVGWNGELVYSFLLRLTLSATHLFVEATHCLLPPLRGAYYEIDFLLRYPTLRQFLVLIARSGLRWPGMMLRCIPRSGRQVFADYLRSQKQRRQRRLIAGLDNFDHGPIFSVRELASDLRSRVPNRFPSLGFLEPVVGPVLSVVLRLFMDSGGRYLNYHRYFQILDRDMYTKVVEKRVFAALAEFLEERNVDPDELKRRAEMIVNNSLTVGDNATVTGGAFSVGHGSRATATSGGQGR